MSHLMPLSLAVYVRRDPYFAVFSRVPARAISVAFTRSIPWRFTSVISQRKRFYIRRWQEPGQMFRLSMLWRARRFPGMNRLNLIAKKSRKFRRLRALGKIKTKS
jgi:hypothetical protein